jgi:hypothetical protein
VMVSCLQAERTMKSDKKTKAWFLTLKSNCIGLQVGGGNVSVYLILFCKE